MIPTVVAIIWMLGSFIVGLFCIHRKLGFWGGFFFSVLLSPIIMILILMMTRQSTDKTLKT
jgi:fumarate reductase subunit C